MGDSFQMVHGNRFGRRNRGAVKHEEDQETGKSLGRSSVPEGEMPGTRRECPRSDVGPFRMPQKRIGDRSAWAVGRARSRAHGRAAGFLSTCELYFRSCPHHMALKFDDRPLTS